MKMSERTRIAIEEIWIPLGCLFLIGWMLVACNEADDLRISGNIPVSDARIEIGD
jgi:hypothetical protein